jgi:hypothetical protein
MGIAPTYRHMNRPTSEGRRAYTLQIFFVAALVVGVDINL